LGENGQLGQAPAESACRRYVRTHLEVNGNLNFYVRSGPNRKPLFTNRGDGKSRLRVYTHDGDTARIACPTSHAADRVCAELLDRFIRGAGVRSWRGGTSSLALARMAYPDGLFLHASDLKSRRGLLRIWRGMPLPFGSPGPLTAGKLAPALEFPSDLMDRPKSIQEVRLPFPYAPVSRWAPDPFMEYLNYRRLRESGQGTLPWLEEAMEHYESLPLAARTWFLRRQIWATEGNLADVADSKKNIAVLQKHLARLMGPDAKLPRD